MAINDIATLGIKVDPKGAISGASKAKKAILGIGNAANGIKSSIFSLQGAIAAIGLGALVKGAVKTSASLETLKIRLKTVTGSTEERRRG
jgi:phage tail tape-measure protein